jgi:HK97 family phage portal protein
MKINMWPFNRNKQEPVTNTRAEYGKWNDDFFQSLGGMSVVNDPFSAHVVVFGAVSAIASAISGVPVKIYKSKTESARQGYRSFNKQRFTTRDGLQRVQDPVRGDGFEVVENGALAELLVNPCPALAGAPQFWQATVLNILLEGSCPTICTDRASEKDLPTELWPLSPKSFKYEEANRLITKWYYKNTIPLMPFQIIRPRLVDPKDLNKGFAPYTPLAPEVNLDVKARTFNDAFFENYAHIGGIILAPPGTSKAQRDIIDETFSTKYVGGGGAKAFKNMIAYGGVDYKPMGLGPKDADFGQQRQLSKALIALCYGVPLSVLGDTSANFATAKVEERRFWMGTNIPLVKMIELTYLSQLCRYVEGGQYWLSFDLMQVEALQENLNEKLGSAKLLFDMGFPPNAINKRLELGMEEVDWGNTGYLPSGLIPAEGGLVAPPQITIPGQPAQPILPARGEAGSNSGQPFRPHIIYPYKVAATSPNGGAICDKDDEG